ncbi:MULTISPECIES: YbhB/YbcL family Raf kinase inhibitor-like protein [Oleiagrimonas]|uniref:YbhB/YbcL family Raf kinase inhibitor-like protein n=1 Tax=Oleiagrimonas citrea TaxID=1665687 RepID=A0A846ZRR5_9GAMM|nr:MULTISPECIES: YbhB/YbcL family Raf kinase inhibitor-like protein [Oleiagrimonas]NKZ40123.1 YbhB/YbcL family Raf kinase inhibitor-like protein [Oleiagrimonas citrea]RAP57088.1 phospholipid-binding protein [Oleiagrimonas sp. MCCC 1A03011]
MKFRSDSFAHGDPIPTEFAFGKIGAPVELSDNRSPHLAWSDAPEGTRSFALICVDPDVPSKPDDVNQEGREVPADLPRVEFVHWVMADIPAECGEFEAGACCEGTTPHGKRDPAGPPGSKQGINDYTGWFAGDESMSGDYYGYDGPCPPWNDSIIHHYHFKLYALDVPSLGLDGRFDLADLRRAMDGHVLAEAEWMGTYTLNPRLAG